LKCCGENKQKMMDIVKKADTSNLVASSRTFIGE
jgi:hypothetical protein